MPPLAPPSLLFGLPLRSGRADAERLLDVLASAWEEEHGRPLGSLDADLARMGRGAFNPTAREQTIRAKLADAPRLPDVVPADGELFVGGLLAPEGRVAIELLEDALASQQGATVELSLADIARAEHRLLVVYRAWTRRRLQNVAALAAGERGPLVPAGIGVVLMLVFAGAVGPRRGVAQRASEDGDSPDDLRRAGVIDGALRFARTIDAETRVAPAAVDLYAGYALTEARRRLDEIEVGPPGRGARTARKRVYLRAGAEARALAFLAGELRRRAVPHDRLGDAIEEAVGAYSARVPSAAAAARRRAAAALTSLSPAPAQPGRAAAVRSRRDASARRGAPRV